MQSLFRRATLISSRTSYFPQGLRLRSFHHANNLYAQQQQQQPVARGGGPHSSFYKTHGRALFKSLTLAFLSFQCFYWAWSMLETEELKDAKKQEIKSLETEVQLLQEGRNSHQPAQLLKEK